MIDESALQLRRQILDWRDRHYEHIYRHLIRELTVLFESIDAALNDLSWSDSFKSEDFFKKRIEPICNQWIKNESDVLINLAQQELNQIIKHLIEHNDELRSLHYRDNTSSVLDAAKAGLSTTAAAAAIPAVISLSTASFLGLTIITSWPVILVGGLTVLSLSHFGFGKAGNLKADATTQIRQSTHETIGSLGFAVVSDCISLKLKFE